MSDNSSNPQRGQYDPGWNDPPRLQYSSSTIQTGKTKLNLNKRIAFPLQSSSSVNTTKPTAIVQPTSLAASNTQISQPPIAIVPPMPQSNPPPSLQNINLLSDLQNSSRNQQQSQNDNDDDSNLGENTREYCLNTFERFICKIQESTNVRIEEVQRRINLMNQMWLNRTLTSSVHRKLFKIAKALEENNFNDAIENHRALVVDHSNVCAAWGAALRQIILTIQQNNSGNQSENSGVINTQRISGNILIPNTDSNNSEIAIATTVASTITDNSNNINPSSIQPSSENNIQNI